MQKSNVVFAVAYLGDAPFPRLSDPIDMQWLSDTLNQLQRLGGVCGYHVDSPPATEPTAVAALALLSHGRSGSAQRALEWLAEAQQESGAIPVTADADGPHWTTSWAMLAWRQHESIVAGQWSSQLEQAANWLLSVRGQTFERATATFGHDTTLAAWPWVAGTHSWIEPTCLAVIALERDGRPRDSRVLEAKRLLRDRLLPTGGCNYGNTSVLGQMLRAHPQPSGMALTALAGADGERLTKTRSYAAREMSRIRSAVSLAWLCIGLTAHHQRPADNQFRLSTAANRTSGEGNSPYRLALLALAAAEHSILVPSEQREAAR